MRSTLLSSSVEARNLACYTLHQPLKEPVLLRVCSLHLLDLEWVEEVLTGFLGVSTRDLNQEPALEESSSALAAGEGAACSTFGAGVGGGGGGGGTTFNSHVQMNQSPALLPP